MYKSFSKGSNIKGEETELYALLNIISGVLYQERNNSFFQVFLTFFIFWQQRLSGTHVEI